MSTGLEYESSHEKRSAGVDGKCLVVPDGGHLPDLCILCGEGTALPPRRIAFTWNPHGLKMGRSITSLAAVATNRRGRIYAYYCPKHKPRKIQNVVKMVLMSVPFLFATKFCADHQYNIECVILPLALTGICILAITLWYVVLPTFMLECKKIEAGFLWIEPAIEKARDKMILKATGGAAGEAHATADSNPV